MWQRIIYSEQKLRYFLSFAIFLYGLLAKLSMSCWSTLTSLVLQRIQESQSINQSIITWTSIIIYHMKVAIVALLVIAALTTNPGILIGVPLPYDLPIDTLVSLPISIGNFNVMETQFTNVEIRQLDFKGAKLRYKPRTLIIKESLVMEVEVSQLLVHFNFRHKGNFGPGTFTDNGLYVKYDFNLEDHDGKVQIHTERIELDEGKVKVNLGGTVEQRFLAIITNIVINYAGPLFYTSLKDAIKNQVVEFNKKIDSQIQFANIHMDLSLLTAPTFNSTYLQIPLNGASYIDNRTGFLNPNDVLKPNGTKPQMQVLVHQDVLDNALKVYLQKNNPNINISMQSVTDVADINSLTLSPILLAMAQQPVSDVIMAFNISNSKVTFVPDFASLTANVVGTIFFQQKQYMTPVPGVLSINGSLIYGLDKIALDVDRIDLTDLKYNQTDIDQGRVDPNGWSAYQPTILRWLTSAFDGILFSKPQQIGEFGVRLLLSGEVKNKYMEVSVVIA